MIDPLDIDAASTKLLAVEARTFGDALQSAPEARSLYRPERRRRQSAEHACRGWSIPQRHRFQPFAQMRQHVGYVLSGAQRRINCSSSSTARSISSSVMSKHGASVKTFLK